MGLLPRTLRGKLALVCAFAITSITVSMMYMRFGGLPYLVNVPEDMLSKPAKTDILSPSVTNETLDSTEPNNNDKSNTGPTTVPTVGSDKPRVLLVSAVFPLQKLKYPSAKYDSWIKNYLNTVTTDIYLFTTPELGPHFQEMRHAGLTITINTTYNNPFEIPPLKDKETLYQRIQKKDRENRGKDNNMTVTYAVRNAKPFFLHNALENLKINSKIYDYAFWNDPASFRNPEHEYREWPSPTNVQNIWEEGSQLTGSNNDDLMFVPVLDSPHASMSYWNEGLGPVDNKLSEGSFFGGTPTAIDFYTRAYYAYHDYYLSLETFIGKDTSIINALFFLFPERFITVWHNDPDAPAHLALNRTTVPEDLNSEPAFFLGQCGSSAWHYYQFWLASSSTKEFMRNLWMREANKWHWWGWWRSVDKNRCQKTRVLDIKSVLRRKFGDGWNGVERTRSIPDRVSWS